MKQTKNEKEQQNAQTTCAEEKTSEVANELSEEELLEKERKYKYFALCKHIYLSLYEGYLLGYEKDTQMSELIEMSETLYSQWIKPLKYLKENGHIDEYSIFNVNSSVSRLVYKFNPQELRYKNECELLRQKIEAKRLYTVPTGEIFKEKRLDDVDCIDMSDRRFNEVSSVFNGSDIIEDDNETEIIDREDSCVVELNAKRRKELKDMGNMAG